MTNQFYITRRRRTEPMREIWNNHTRTWQWFYDSSNRPYSSIGRAQRVLDKMARDGYVKFNTINPVDGVTVYDDPAIIRVDIFWKQREERIA